MAEKSEGKIVRRRVGEVPKTSAEELARMASIVDKEIDTSDIPEQTGEGDRLVRDQDGRLPRRESKIREVVAQAMSDSGLTVYALCKEARVYCSTISESAVGQFLKGRRSIGLDYLEAIFEALEIHVSCTSNRGRYSAEPPIIVGPLEDQKERKRSSRTA